MRKAIRAREMYEFGTRKLISAQETYADFAQSTPRYRQAQLRIKRVIDVVGAVVLAIFLAPLLIVTAMSIRVSSPGPIIFTQSRTGLGGRRFRIMKFRTMRVMEDGDEVVQVSPKDERLTAVGAFLRRTSIDELPQLINVIKGEMSLVGPRPHALIHDDEFVALVPDYNLRFRMRPGITGLAQTSGLRGSILSPDQIAARVALDNSYIDDWSLGCDLKILLRTALGFPFHRAF